MAFIKAACNLYKTRGVHIKYACGIRMIANGGRIAGQSEDIVYAKGIGPQEFCLKPDCVAVAAGQVENGFYAVFLLNDRGEGNRAHPKPCHGAVSDIDSIHVIGNFCNLLFSNFRRSAFGRIQFSGNCKDVILVFGP